MRIPCPVAKDRLIGVDVIDGVRMIEMGDLTAAIPRWPHTPAMRLATRRAIRNRQFVATDVARKWAMDLDKEQAPVLAAVLDWADRIPLAQPRREVTVDAHVA